MREPPSFKEQREEDDTVYDKTAGNRSVQSPTLRRWIEGLLLGAHRFFTSGALAPYM